jgi:transposase
MNRVISDIALCRRAFGEILQERYGRPEMVESAMKRKLNLFPTLTNKDNVKLYDLCNV